MNKLDKAIQINKEMDKLTNALALCNEDFLISKNGFEERYGHIVYMGDTEQVHIQIDDQKMYLKPHVAQKLQIALTKFFID